MRRAPLGAWLQAAKYAACSGRSEASLASGACASALAAAVTPAVQLRSHATATESPELDPITTKIHLLKCKKSTPTPVAQAVAIMLSRDQISAASMERNMEILSRQFEDQAGSAGPAELAAFCECCRKLDFVDVAVFEAVAASAAPRLEDFEPDELASILWALAHLPELEALGGPAQDAGAAPAGQLPCHAPGTGATDPAVLHGAGQAVLARMDDFGHDDLPVVLQAFARTGYRDPFTLTALADTVLERLHDFSADELVMLAEAWTRMGKQFYYNKLFDLLADELVARHKLDEISSAALAGVAAQYVATKHKHPALQAAVAPKASLS